MASGNKGWTESESFDWDNTSDAPPPPLEDAIYRCTIVKAEAEPTAKGAPAGSLQLQVTAKHGSDEKLSRKLFDKLVFTKEAAFRVKQLGNATGVDLPKSSAFDDVSDFCGNLVGQEVWVKTRQQTYEGKTNARVDMYVSEAKLAEVLGGGGSGDEAAAAPRRRRPAAA